MRFADIYAACQLLEKGTKYVYFPHTDRNTHTHTRTHMQISSSSVLLFFFVFLCILFATRIKVCCSRIIHATKELALCHAHTLSLHSPRHGTISSSVVKYFNAFGIYLP